MLVIMPKFCTWFCGSELETYSKFITKYYNIDFFLGKEGKSGKILVLLQGCELRCSKLL
jgi:hypothetical protein